MIITFFVNAAWYFELHWLDRAKFLIKNGHTVHLVSNFQNSNIKNNLENFNVKCHHMELSRFSKNPLHNLYMLYNFNKLINEIQPDLVHLITIKPILLGGLVLKLRKIPFVVSFVGLGRVFGSGKVKILHNLVIKLYGFILSNNKKAHVIFEHLHDFNVLKKHIEFIQSNVFIIDGAGIDTTKYNYSLEVNRGNIIVLFASRLLWSKGLGELVEAVALLKEKNINITLQVAGILDKDDPDRIDIKIIEEWSKLKKIEWLGQRNDIEKIIKNVNLVVLPTKYSEGVPRIILEACSIGRACIVSNVPGCQSIIKNGYNGIILERVTAGEIAAQIEQLTLNYPLRCQYGERSSLIIHEKYDNKIVLKKTYEVYESLLSKRHNS